MRFTVFTPTYSRGHALPRLYQSLCRQTLQDFEWLVVDDGSTDGTEELLASIQSRHEGFPNTVLRTRNRGKHRAVNAGVAAAAVDLFFIVDSDDFLPDDALLIVDDVERSIPIEDRGQFAGVCGLKGYPDGTRWAPPSTGTSSSNHHPRARGLRARPRRLHRRHAGLSVPRVSGERLTTRKVAQGD